MSALRIVADWLAHPEYGVNAVLPGLPRDPAEPPPKPVTLANELDDGWVARLHITGEVAKGGPYLAVTLAAEGNDFDPMPVAARATDPITGDDVDAWVLEGHASVMLLYVTRDSKSERGTRHAHQVLRAARNALTLLFDKATPKAVRLRDCVTLATCTGFKPLALHEERGDALITGGLLASYTVREEVLVRTPDPDPVPPPEP